MNRDITDEESEVNKGGNPAPSPELASTKDGSLTQAFDQKEKVESKTPSLHSFPESGAPLSGDYFDSPTRSSLKRKGSLRFKHSALPQTGSHTEFITPRQAIRDMSPQRKILCRASSRQWRSRRPALGAGGGGSTLCVLSNKEPALLAYTCSHSGESELHSPREQLGENPLHQREPSAGNTDGEPTSGWSSQHNQ